MVNTALSSRTAIALFNALKRNTKLKCLYINYNDVTDDTSDAIATALKSYNGLVTLHMHRNPLSSETIVKMVDTLKVKYTLKLLWLPTCPTNIKKRISSLQKVINDKRESQGCQVKLRIIYG